MSPSVTAEYQRRDLRITLALTSCQGRTVQGTAVKLEKPDWANQIERLRTRLGLSQMELAKKVGVSAMAISRWERGINEPSAGCYITLGKLAGAPECWIFWGRTGLTKEEVERCL